MRPPRGSPRGARRRPLPGRPPRSHPPTRSSCSPPSSGRTADRELVGHRATACLRRRRRRSERDTTVDEGGEPSEKLPARGLVQSRRGTPSTDHHLHLPAGCDCDRCAARAPDPHGSRMDDRRRPAGDHDAGRRGGRNPDWRGRHSRPRAGRVQIDEMDRASPGREACAARSPW